MDIYTQIEKVLMGLLIASMAYVYWKGMRLKNDLSGELKLVYSPANKGFALLLVMGAIAANYIATESRYEDIIVLIIFSIPIIYILLEHFLKVVTYDYSKITVHSPVLGKHNFKWEDIIGSSFNPFFRFYIFRTNSKKRFYLAYNMVGIAGFFEVMDSKMKSVYPERYVAQNHAFNNQEEISASSICGCFFCLSVFQPNKIVKYEQGIAAGLKTSTAICPNCSMSTVIGDKSGYPIDNDSLALVRELYFKT